MTARRAHFGCTVQRLASIAASIAAVALLAACGAAPDGTGKDSEAGDAGEAPAQAPCDDPYQFGTTPASIEEVDPTVCFYEKPPGPDEQVADLPMPDASCCERPPPLFFKDDDPAHEPTLELELGRSDPLTGAFVPWQQGQWVPVKFGPGPPYVAVLTAFRVVLPTETAAKVKLFVQARGYFNCKETAFGTSPVVWVRQDGELEEGYTNASPVAADMQVRFPVHPGSFYKYCGIWMEMRVAVLEPVSGAWGTGSVMVRTYQSSPKMP